MRKDEGTLKNFILFYRELFFSYLDYSGAFKHIERDINRGDVFFELLPGF